MQMNGRQEAVIFFINVLHYVFYFFNQLNNVYETSLALCGQAIVRAHGVIIRNSFQRFNEIFVVAGSPTVHNFTPERLSIFNYYELVCDTLRDEAI